MRPIPPKTREYLSNLPFMKKCCLCGAGGRVEWHHNLIYGGEQSNIKETILPLCPSCHRGANKKETKEQLDFIMLQRMSKIQIICISKAVDYLDRLAYLKQKYG